MADFGFCSLPGGARIFMLSNYQPLCPATGLVNLFSTFLGVTKYISKALPLISGEYAAEEPSPPFWAQPPTPQLRHPSRGAARTRARRCDKLLLHTWRWGTEGRSKLIIRVQFSVSAEVTQLCHAGRWNSAKPGFHCQSCSSDCSWGLGRNIWVKIERYEKLGKFLYRILLQWYQLSIIYFLSFPTGWLQRKFGLALKTYESM